MTQSLPLVLALSFLVASPLAHSADRAFPKGARVTLEHSDSPVGTYVSSGPGFFTRSYWIEGPEGLILIDTQFLLSAATEAVDWAEKATGKKVKLAIVLHPNPDKFNGTEVLRKRGIRVVTSEQVRKLIPSVHELRLKWFYDDYKPDYPKEVPLPESFGAKTTELSAGGVTVKAHVLGAGCSGAHVVVEYDGHLFPGDLVTNDFHSWLELGMLEDWLKRIAELKALEPEFVHPGRGPEGDAGLLDQQEAYLKTVLQIAREEKKGPKDAAIARMQKRIEAAYPGYLYPLFVTNGLEAIYSKRSK